MAGTHISLMGSTLTDTDSFVADYYNFNFTGTPPNYFDAYTENYSGYSSSLSQLDQSTISNGTFNITNDSIVSLYLYTRDYAFDTDFESFYFRINDQVSNSGWERLIINNSSGTRLVTLNRADGFFSSGTGYSQWQWVVLPYTYSHFTLGQTYDFYIRQ